MVYVKWVLWLLMELIDHVILCNIRYKGFDLWDDIYNELNWIDINLCKHVENILTEKYI